MRSSELRRYFLTVYDKDTHEWSTTLYDKDTHKVEPLKIKVKVKDGEKEVIHITYKFYQNESATSCRFIDAMTGEEKIFRKCKGWELS